MKKNVRLNFGRLNQNQMKLKNPFRKKPISPYLPKLELAMEHEGKKYYRFQQKTFVPAGRFVYVDQLLELRSLGLSGAEMDKIIDLMEQALVMDMSKPPNIGKIGFYIECIRSRRELVLHRDILINIAAYLLIREDEDPKFVHKTIHEEKVALFEKLADGGQQSYDFFTSAALEPLSIFQSMSREQFVELWEYNSAQIKSLKKTLERLNKSLTP